MIGRNLRQLGCAAWQEFTKGLGTVQTLLFARPLSTIYDLMLLGSKVLLVALLFWIVFQDYLRDIHWSYVIEAETRGAQIEFTGNSNAWRLDGAFWCHRLDVPLRTARDPDAEKVPLCDSRVYEQDGPAIVTIQWREGDRITVRTDDIGRLEIRLDQESAVEEGKTGKPAEEQPLEIRADGQAETLKSGDLLILNPQGWARSGALIFTGRLVIGAEMSSGQTAYLLGGRYEVRDSGLQSWLSSEDIHTILKGTLSRGEQVRVVSAQEDRNTAASFGHITMRDEDVTKAGFRVTMASQNGDTDLEIRRHSRAQPSYVRPDWIDTLETSPLLLGLVALVTVFANLAQIPPFGSRRGS